MLILFCIIGWLTTIVLIYYLTKIKRKYSPNKNLNFIDNIYIDAIDDKHYWYGTINTMDSYGNAIIIFKNNISCDYSKAAKNTVMEHFERICENFGFDKDTGKKL